MLLCGNLSVFLSCLFKRAVHESQLNKNVINFPHQVVEVSDRKHSVQERHGPVEVGPEEGHKNNQRDGTPLLQGKAERVGVI